MFNSVLWMNISVLISYVFRLLTPREDHLQSHPYFDALLYASKICFVRFKTRYWRTCRFKRLLHRYFWKFHFLLRVLYEQVVLDGCFEEIEEMKPESFSFHAKNEPMTEIFV